MPGEIKEAIPQILEVLDLLKMPVLRIHGVEADDVIGTLATRYANQGAGVMIVSSDKVNCYLLWVKLDSYVYIHSYLNQISDSPEPAGLKASHLYQINLTAHLKNCSSWGNWSVAEYFCSLQMRHVQYELLQAAKHWSNNTDKWEDILAGFLSALVWPHTTVTSCKAYQIKWGATRCRILGRSQVIQCQCIWEWVWDTTISGMSLIHAGIFFTLSPFSAKFE